MRTVLLSLILLLIPQAGYTQTAPITVKLRTGSDWMLSCGKNPFDRTGWTQADYMSLAFCSGHIEGFSSAAELLELPQNLRACFDPGVSRGEIQAVVTKHLNDHPSQLHEDLRTVFIAALSTNYPCKR